MLQVHRPLRRVRWALTCVVNSFVLLSLTSQLNWSVMVEQRRGHSENSFRCFNEAQDHKTDWSNLCQGSFARMLPKQYIRSCRTSPMNSVRCIFGSRGKSLENRRGPTPSPHLDNAVCTWHDSGHRNINQKTRLRLTFPSIKMRHLSHFLQRKFRKSFFLALQLYLQILWSIQEENPIEMYPSSTKTNLHF